MKRLVLRLAAGMLYVTSVFFCGCASRGVIVNTTPLWPFQKLEIRTTHAGIVRGYYSRPQVEPRYLIVVLQNPLCQPSDALSANDAAISTGGVLWERVAKTSAFLQFEHPIGRRESLESSTVDRAGCEATSQTGLSSRDWQSAVSEVVGALREQERLRGLPTIYLGFAQGALPAIELAGKDRRAAALGLVSARIPAEAAARIRVPLVLVQGSRDEKEFVESSNSLYSRLSQRGQAVSMLTFRELGHDLGLSDGKPECFETAMEALATQALAFADERARKINGRQELDCPDLDIPADPDAPVIEALPR
jgi:hypothetical protein